MSGRRLADATDLASTIYETELPFSRPVCTHCLDEALGREDWIQEYCCGHSSGLSMIFAAQWIPVVRIPINPTTILIAICAAGLILRALSVFVFAGEFPRGDARWNHETAIHILGNGGYSLVGTGQPTAWNLPGYHFVLALIYGIFAPNHLYAGAFHAIVGVACIVLVYMLAKEYVSDKVALACAAMYAIWPSAIIVYTPKLHNTTLFSFFVLAVIILSTRAYRNPTAKNLLILFATLAISIYVRPELVLFPFALFGIFMAKRIPFKGALGLTLLAFAVILVVLSPWIVRNYLVFDKFIPLSTSGSYNMAKGNSLRLTGNGHGGAIFPPGADTDKPVSSYELYWQENGYRIALDGITNNTGEWMAAKAKVIYWLWNSDTPRHFSSTSIDPETAALVWPYIRVHWMMVLMLAFAGVVATCLRAGNALAKRQSMEPAIILVLLLVYWNLFFIAMFGLARYNVPVIPCLIILACVGAQDALNLFKATIRRQYNAN